MNISWISSIFRPTDGAISTTWSDPALDSQRRDAANLLN
jgi:hypothetical protein